MELTERIFNWAEKKSLQAAYGYSLEKEKPENSNIFADWLAMSITAPRLAYRLIKEKCYS